MNDVAIRVEELGKRYRLGQRESYRVLRDVLADALVAPLRAAKSVLTGGRPPGHDRAADDHVWALRDITFEVHQGEVVGIIGPNGAGKTTLLKILSRITEPTQGCVTVRGRVGSLLEVGTGFHPELTGRENIYLNGAILGMRKAGIERQFDAIVEFSGVEKFIDTPVKHYSSGMYVRLAFAVAAHLEPEILLVDEVLAVGDASFQKKCLGKMRDVAGEGRTVLFVSHNMTAIMRLCPRAILLENGFLALDGPATDVVAAYLRHVTEDGGSRSWPLATAPGTAEVKLVSVALTKDDGSPVSTANVEDELRLRIGYVVGRPGLRLRCAALFFTQGVCAFASLEPLETERAQAGVYYSTVAIPPNLLAEGEYSVGVSIFSSRGVKSNHVTARDLVVFQVVDSASGESARGDYLGGFAGVMRPLLRWETRFGGDS